MTQLAPIATLFRDPLSRELNLPVMPDRTEGARHRRAEPPVRRRPV
jgi:hypothetical protein